MFLFLVFIIAPIAWGVILSMYRYSPLSRIVPFIGLDNFKNLLTDKVFIKSFINTFEFVGIAVPVNIILTLLIALGINKVRNVHIRNTFRIMFFLPAIVPLAGSSIVWLTMFNLRGGLLNIILRNIGLNSVKWLGDPSIAMISIIIMTLWADMGYNIVIFMAGLDSIPDRFYEAAKLDGATRLKSFWYITLPLLNRTTLFVTIMTIISYFQMFPQFQIITKGEPQNATRVLALNIYDEAFKYMNMGYASAMATVLLFIILIITLVQLHIGSSQWEY
jgi:multiple sugar transport system permease protein